MKHLSKPTSRLPNKRLVVEEEFISDLVEVVNELNDAVKNLSDSVARIDYNLNVESERRRSGDLDLSRRLENTAIALEKVSEAMNIILGGN